MYVHLWCLFKAGKLLDGFKRWSGMILLTRIQARVGGGLDQGGGGGGEGV